MTKQRTTHIRFGELVLLFSANKEEIGEAILSGRTTHLDLAEEHGVSRTTVSDLLVAAGIPTRPAAKVEPVTNKEILLLTAKTLAQLLRKMGEPNVELEGLLHRGGI